MSKEGPDNRWNVGSIGFNDWYFVYDMSAYDEDQETNFPRIGLGLKNKNINILKE